MKAPFYKKHIFRAAYRNEKNDENKHVAIHEHCYYHYNTVMEVAMDVNLIKGLFAVYVVGVSLLSMLSDEESHLLTAMKKVWGRSRGLLLHFTANVLIPMLFALVSFSRGVVSMAGY